MTNYQYQVGGSLKKKSLTYVERQADRELYKALIKGEFCYVLNSRQMGKSSLKVRVKERLTQAGFACVSIDLTGLGSQETTGEQWYKGLALDLLRGLNLFPKIQFKQWWQERKDISAPQRLIKVIEEIIFRQIKTQKITIFIDEIDSIISLPFSSDDFFSLIRYCYNQRAEHKEYERLTFALFGVATPGDLIGDPIRTPFNIGKAIYLTGFKLEEAQPLVKGLETIFSQPQEILAEILSWTGGQPFLTQKLCNLILHNHQKSSQSSKKFIENIVQTQVIDNWQTQDEPQHLKTISARLLAKEEQAGSLLSIYQKILKKGSVKASDSYQQELLLLSGLVVKEGGELKVYNQIYQQVFSEEWVREKLNNLRPYAQYLNDWLASNRQDSSRLLRGTALKIAQIWASDKSLSDEDYQFLAASVALEQQQRQQALEAQRLKEVEARLAIEEKSIRRQTILLGVISLALVIATGLGFTAFKQYRQAQLGQIRALAESSRSLFADSRQLEALILAIKAKRQLQNYGQADRQTSQIVDAALGQAIYGSFEFNRLSGHTDGISDVDFSPDSQEIATASWDGMVKIWSLDGSLRQTITRHQGRVFSVAFTPDGKQIASGSTDGTIKLSTREGQLIRTFSANLPVYCVNLSPDGKLIAAAAGDTVQLWALNGKLRKTLSGHTGEVHTLDYSDDGKYLASGSKDKTIKIWDVETGTLVRTLTGHHHTVWGLEFSLDNKNILSASEDRTLKIWTVEGKLLQTIPAHTSGVLNATYSLLGGTTILSVGRDRQLKIWLLDGTLIIILRGHHDGILDVDTSYDGQIIASSSWDKTVKLWKQNDFLLKKIRAHNSEIRGVGLSGDNQLMITASGDNTVKVWSQSGILKHTFTLHSDGIYHLSVSPDGQTIATVGMDRIVRIWKLDGTLVNNSFGHQKWITSVAWSPNGNHLVSGSWDQTVKLWSKDGKLLKTFPGHQNGVLDVDFGSDSQLIASASFDRTVKLWKLDGTLVRTIKAHNLAVRAVALDPQGKFLVSGSRDRTLKIWSMEGKLLKTLTDHQERIWDVIFSPDGEIFASAADDKSIKIWDRKGKLLKTIYINYLTRSMAFSSDGKMLITGGVDNTTRLWNLTKILETNELEYACNWVRDYLRNNPEVSPSERKLC